MTAIGVLMMMLGFLVVSLTENEDTEDMGAKIFLAGAVLASVGVVLWLWRVMP